MVSLEDIGGFLVLAAHTKEETLGLGLPDPKTFTEATAATDGQLWLAPFDGEYASLKKKDVMEEVDELPPGRKAIDTRHVFRRKTTLDGLIAKRKVRLTPKGFQQRPGVDYDETFAPTVHHNTMRVFLSIAAADDLELRQMDVETAFLHAPLKEEVYITLPHDHPNRLRADGKPRIFRLKKALYGLKQGPHDWNVEFNETLVKKCGFTRLQSDACAYGKRSRTGKLITMVVFVDDTVMSYSKQDQAETDEIMSIIKSVYSVVDLGEAKHILGMRIMRDREAKTLTLDHERFILDLLEKTGMKNCVPVSTPEEPGVHLLSTGAVSAKHPREQLPAFVAGHEGDWKAKVGSVVGALLYTAGWLRPDIQHAVIQIARFVSNPQPAHWQACKRILRYLRGTPSLGLTFGRLSKGVKPSEPMAFSDASWGNDLGDRRSTTGVVVKMNGGAIIWTSRKQKCVAQSSTEAEYMALGDATKEILWLRQLLTEMMHPIDGPTPLVGDNEGALATAKHDAHHSRMKHIDIKHHFIREHVACGDIKLIWVPTQKQQADILTKGLGKVSFNELRARVMGTGDADGSDALLVRVMSSQILEGPRRQETTRCGTNEVQGAHELRSQGVERSSQGVGTPNRYSLADTCASVLAEITEKHNHVGASPLDCVLRNLPTENRVPEGAPKSARGHDEPRPIVAQASTEYLPKPPPIVARSAGSSVHIRANTVALPTPRTTRDAAAHEHEARDSMMHGPRLEENTKPGDTKMKVVDLEAVSSPTTGALRPTAPPTVHLSLQPEREWREVMFKGYGGAVVGRPCPARRAALNSRTRQGQIGGRDTRRTRTNSNTEGTHDEDLHQSTTINKKSSKRHKSRAADC